ncbi:MAG: hypothetical protein H3C36_02095 [Chitinophagaceae bacterium]|nr:hypothetical protein [Chitinophagaceae bacterium]
MKHGSIKSEVIITESISQSGTVKRVVRVNDSFFYGESFPADLRSKGNPELNAFIEWLSNREKRDDRRNISHDRSESVGSLRESFFKRLKFKMKQI